MKLSTYMSSRQMTDQGLAEKVGVSRHAVDKWRRGTRIPRLETMRAISAATEGYVTANDFFGVAPYPESEVAA